MAHPLEWKERAKELWELGWKPSRVIDAIEKEFGHRLKYTTLKDWADKGGWKHFVDHDTPKNLNPNLPAGVSGIADPIYHLSLVLGKRLVREDAATRSTATDRFSRPPAIVARALTEVDREYDPGPDTLDYLKPVLMRYSATIQRATGRVNQLNHDPERNPSSQNRLARGMQEILAEALANGIEIDDGHAGLDIVYTNQDDDEVEEE
jgi:hypothetical protein